jgi:hypothetical protein
MCYIVLLNLLFLFEFVKEFVNGLQCVLHCFCFAHIETGDCPRIGSLKTPHRIDTTGLLQVLVVIPVALSTEVVCENGVATFLTRPSIGLIPFLLLDLGLRLDLLGHIGKHSIYRGASRFQFFQAQEI